MLRVGLTMGFRVGDKADTYARSIQICRDL